MQKTTQIKILDYLRSHDMASVREISTTLGTTGADIRHHLSTLRVLNQVEVVMRRKQRLGRPVSLYSLSNANSENRFSELVKGMIKEWLRPQDDLTQQEKIRALATHLCRKLPRTDDLPRLRILSETITSLNKMNYHARWEAGRDGPVVILGRCPYAFISADCPELCQLDGYLLEQLIGMRFRKIETEKSDSQDIPSCLFQAF